MITTSYVYALYDFAYDIVNNAEKTNIRCAVYNWEQYLACASEVIEEIGRALGVDRSALSALALANCRDYDHTFTTLEAAEKYCDEMEGRGVGPLAICED